jgi:hypothetical protein
MMRENRQQPVTARRDEGRSDQGERTRAPRRWVEDERAAPSPSGLTGFWMNWAEAPTVVLRGRTKRRANWRDQNGGRRSAGTAPKPAPLDTSRDVRGVDHPGMGKSWGRDRGTAARCAMELSRRGPRGHCGACGHLLRGTGDQSRDRTETGQADEKRRPSGVGDSGQALREI